MLAEEVLLGQPEVLVTGAADKKRCQVQPAKAVRVSALR